MPLSPIAPPPERFAIRGVKNAPPAPVDDAHEPHSPIGPPPWLPLGLGLGVAFLLHALLPCMFAWFLAAIPHEMGHATVGCLLGRPSAPAISLAGHAWTGIQNQVPALVWLYVAGLAGAAWWQRAHVLRAALLGGAALVLPLVAFTGLAEIAIAAAGHLGELAFAAWCYATCWRGGYTGTLQERIAGATAGALLQFQNLRLCWGLLTDAGARELYASNGSLGLKNDYLVLAEDLCHCHLQSVAMLMFVVALAALPLGLLAGWLRTRADR